MAIYRKDPEVPRALPPARLYLDDIEEIVSVFSQAMLLYKDTTQENDQPKATYYVANQYTTELEDLPKIAKSTTDFMLTMETRELELRFQLEQRGPWWWSSGLKRADAWATFHKLEALFKNRAPRVSAFRAEVISFVFAFTLSIVVVAVLPLHSLSAKAHVPETIATIVTSAVTALVAIQATKPLFPHHTLVVLRHSWEQANLREDRNTKILIAAVSAVIAFALGILSTALKHKYWP